jgi:hypothetical protein
MTQERGKEGEEGGAGAAGGLRGVWRQLSTTLRSRTRLRRQLKARARAQQLKYLTPEQLAYADALEVGLTIGRWFLAGTFMVYIFGLVPPKVALSRLTASWSLPAEEYSRLVGVGDGWGWIELVRYGDYMNLPAISFLASVTAICFLRLLPISLRNDDRLLSTILLLQVLVLFLAASGFLTIGHQR